MDGVPVGRDRAFEVYVRPYPAVVSGRWQVSAGGGTSPRWSADGRELFLHDGESLMRAEVDTRAPSFTARKPAPLFAVKPFGGRLGPDFEVARDGQRFLFLLPAPALTPAPAGLVIVQNWVHELRARLDATR